ncbi:hypothetical protein AVEN_185345-1 [Araneus ventricosus]|uniref:Uncharacterized protein n=1 Tax=Araneus ventricosus TaxID=182803 RepID=A0A4Y2QXJ3_ARAVE|nr:hypothetical protein AVEN_185345-1 [Araneus ventricosus]
MEGTSFFRGGASVFPMLWMWTKMFVFHEASCWMALVSYVGIFSWYSLLVLLSFPDELLAKNSKMDKEAQTIAHRMRDQSVQIEEFLDSAINSEESEKEDSEFGEGDNTLSTETDTIQDESTESEGSIMEPDSDSVPLLFSSLLPEPLSSEAAIAARLGIKTTVKKMKFLVPTDPRLFIDDEMPMKEDKVAQWYLQYIKEEHEKKREEKQLSFFQRKVRKITKLFKKKEKNQRECSPLNFLVYFPQKVPFLLSLRG